MKQRFGLGIVLAGLAVFFFGVSYLAEIIFFWLNKAFILANVGALPFKYQVAYGYYHGEWWAFAFSLVVALICTLSLYIGIKNN